MTSAPSRASLIGSSSGTLGATFFGESTALGSSPLRGAMQTARGAREASRLHARRQRRSAQGQSQRHEPRTYRKTRDSPGRDPRRETPAEWRADADQIAARVGCMAAVLKPSERRAASAGGKPQGAAGPRSSAASSLWPCSRKWTRQRPTWAAPWPPVRTRRQPWAKTYSPKRNRAVGTGFPPLC